MTSRKPIGPGPGKYELPTNVGFVNHSVAKQRMPCYSIGTRSTLPNKLIGPGPGGYGLTYLTRYGKFTGLQYTMAPRTFVSNKNTGPGPGAHGDPKKPGISAPAYTMSARNNFFFKNCVPGPNAYDFQVKLTKPSPPQYSIGTKNELQEKQKSPGPAEYQPIKLEYYKNCNPLYTMGARDNFAFKRNTPGANRYDLQYYKPGKSRPVYSFGTRHSQFAPPMIVKCDNL